MIICEEATEELDKELDALEESLRKQGYDLEQLERDNPYNQWMYE